MNKYMNSEYLSRDFLKIEKELSKQKDIRIEINDGLEAVLSEIQKMNDRLSYSVTCEKRLFIQMTS